MNIRPEDLVYFEKEIQEWRSGLFSYMEIMKKIEKRKKEMMATDPYRTHDDSIACTEAREAGFKEGIESGIEKSKTLVAKMRKAVYAMMAVCVFTAGASYCFGKLHGHERSPAPCKDEAFYLAGGDPHATCTYSGGLSSVYNYTLYCLCPGETFAK